MVPAAASLAEPARQVHRPAVLVTLVWLATVAVDLFLHAGLLAPLFDWDSPFLLSPQDAFVRIPAGYFGLLVQVIGLTWLLLRLGIKDSRRAAIVAAIGGALVWGSLVLGLWSISSADPWLLVGWWAGQTAELGVAGYLIGSALGGMQLRTVGLRVLVLIVAAIAAAVLLQSIGYATAPVLT